MSPRRHRPSERARASSRAPKQADTAGQRSVSGEGAVAEDPWLGRTGLILIAAKAALVPLALDLDADDIFALPKSAVSRALMYAMVAVLAAYVVRRRQVRWSPIWVPLAAYVLLATAATIVAVHQPTALYGAPRRFLGLSSILDGVVLTLSVAVFVRSLRDLRGLATSLFGAASIVLAYGLLQAVGRDPVRWIDPGMTSTIGNTGAFAGYAVTTAALSLTALLLRWVTLTAWERIALGLISFVGGVAVMWAGTRSASLAIPVAVIASLFFLWRAKAPVARLTDLRIPGLAMGAAVLVMLVTAPYTNAGTRLSALLRGGDLSTSERALIYRASLDAIRLRPLLGAGPDGFIVVYPSVRPPEITRISGAQQSQSSTHSWFLHPAVGVGLAGLGAALAAVAVALASAWRRARDPLAVSAVLGAVGLIVFLTQGMFSIAHVATEWLFWFCLGLVAVPRLSTDHTEASARENRRGSGVHAGARRGDLLASVAALALGAVLASTVVSSLSASEAARASNRAREVGNFGAAEHFAELAVRRDAGRADYWNVLGLAHSGRSPQVAADAFEKATATAPYDSVYLLNLAREELMLARTAPPYRERAARHARRAAEIDPNNPVTRLEHSKVLLLVGDLRGAVAEAERAIAIAPEMPGSYEWASLLHAAAGEPKLAIERLERWIALSSSGADLSPGTRLRLARLHAEAGDLAAARSLVAPLKVVDANYSCWPRHGTVTRAETLPRCVRIVFEIEEVLQSDPQQPTAVVRTDRYRLGGLPLPIGTLVEYDGERSAIIQFPPDVSPPLPGTAITLSGIADLYGNVIRPDPTVIVVR